MTWFDLVALVLVVLVAWVESIRGFGRALVDLVGGIVIVRLAPMLAGRLADSARIMYTPDANRAVWFGLLFVVMATLVVLASRLVYSSTLLSLDYFDPILGATFGVATGAILAFAFLHTLQLSYGTSGAGQTLMASFAGQELLEMRSFHKALRAMYHLGDV